MKLTGKTIAAAALASTALVAAIAVIPSYAQEAATPAPVETAQLHAGIFVARGPLPGMPGFGPVGFGEEFAAFDADGNGTITQAEIDAARAAQLAEFDANGDGTLNLEEYQALWLARMYERMVDGFQHLDANGDGTVTAEEFNAGFANLVAVLDADGDGALGPTDRPERPDVQRPIRVPFGFGGPLGPSR